MAEFVDYRPVSRSPAPCRFFMSQQGCRYGHSCRFLHMDGTQQAMGLPNMMPPQGPVMMTPNPVYMVQPGQYSGPSDRGGIPCRFFNTRGCRNGDRCPYLHVQENTMSSKQYSEMTEDQKNNDKSRRVRVKLPGLQVLKCSVCRGDFVRRPGGDRDIREVLKEHYEQMFYARNGPHTKYLEQDIFQVDETHPFVTCPAENCWQQYPNVLDMIYHLGEQSDLRDKAPTRESFQHQFCLSAVARHFSWRDTLEYLNIDEFDSEEDKAKTLRSFNLELFTLLNLDNHETQEDKEIEDAIDKEMAKEMMKLELEQQQKQKGGSSGDARLQNNYEGANNVSGGGGGPDEEDFMCHDFTDDDVLELAAQGINPGDPEARAALDMIRNGGGY